MWWRGDGNRIDTIHMCFSTARLNSKRLVASVSRAYSHVQKKRTGEKIHHRSDALRKVIAAGVESSTVYRENVQWLKG